MRVIGIENGLVYSPVILRWLMAGCVAVCLWLPVHAFAAGTINIYSHRQQFLIQPFLDVSTKTTGIETKIVYASKGLAQRLQAEGVASPADVTLTGDITRLSEYANLDLLTPVESAVLKTNIPVHLRASDNRWFGLSERARIVVTSHDRVPTDAIQRIEDLADAERQQGICNFATMNSHYFGNMKFNDDAEQRSWADAIRVVFTSQADCGNHINISGGGVVKHSRNKQQAVAFLEFLTGEVAQQLYGTVNYEYPVNLAVIPPSELFSWGPFKRDKMPIERLAKLATQAQMIIDCVRW